jgi:serpin B
MINNLENIGIQEAFFTGFAQFDISDSGTGFIYINKVLHQAVITVDENGTNSYKALEVTSDKTDPEKDVIPFHVNRAFAFAVTHRASGAVVYLGLINEIGEN